MNLRGIYFWTQTSSPSNQWIHIVLNYIGPDDGQWIQIYLDGDLIESDITRSSGYYPPGDGRVKLGTPESPGINAVDDVNELLFFNNSLNDDQIMKIKNMIWSYKTCFCKSREMCIRIHKLEVLTRSCFNYFSEWENNPGETSSEVQNRGISGPTKRTHVLQKFLKKRMGKQDQKKRVAIQTFAQKELSVCDGISLTFGFLTISKSGRSDRNENVNF